MKTEWEYEKLGNVCVSFSGYTPSADLLKDKGIYPYFKVAEMNRPQNKRTLISTNAYIDNPSRIYKKGAIVFPKNGAAISTNKKRVLAQDSVVDLNTGGFLVDDIKLNNWYFFYYMQHLDFQMFVRRGAVPTLDIAELKKLDVPIPSLSEQQHIVEELDLLSSIIEKKKAQLNELDNLAQSLFYEMFGESSNWECKQLKEITTKMGSGATPRGGNQSYKEDGVSLIRSLNVHNGHFKYDDLAHIDEQQASQLDNVTIKENDVLLNITGASVARCCIVPTDILPARVNQHVSILRVKETLLNSTYLCHCLISPNSQAELLIMSKSNAATREALPKATLEKYLVPIPPLDLQNQFAEKVQAIEHQKELIEKSIKEVETLFNSRMDYYFN